MLRERLLDSLGSGGCFCSSEAAVRKLGCGGVCLNVKISCRRSRTAVLGTVSAKPLHSVALKFLLQVWGRFLRDQLGFPRKLFAVCVCVCLCVCVCSV